MASVARGVQLSLGLINVTVRIDSARATVTDTDMVTVCANGHDPEKVRRPYVCDTCHNEPAWDTLSKGKVNAAGKLVVVTQDEVKELKDATTTIYKKAVNLVAHPREEFDAATGQGDKLYYLSPDTEGQNAAYALFAATLKAHPEITLAGMWTPRSKAGLFRLRVVGDVLIMEERLRDAQIIEPPVIEAEANEAHIAMLETLLPSMVTPFDATAYEDQYAKAFNDLIAARDGVDYDPATATTTTKPVQGADNVMAALTAMLQTA